MASAQMQRYLAETGRITIPPTGRGPGGILTRVGPSGSSSTDKGLVLIGLYHRSATQDWRWDVAWRKYLAVSTTYMDPLIFPSGGPRQL